MATGHVGPWGDRPPRRPAVGAGRTALGRRVTARGGNERRRAAEAARRGMKRGPSGRLLQRVAEVEIPKPVKSALVEVARQSRLVQQKFLQRQRLRHIGIGLLVIWLLWTFVLGDAGVPRLLWVQWQNERLEREIGRLEMENARLEADVRQLKNGEDGIVDRLAREEHALVRDGEILVRFYEGKRPSVVSLAEKAKKKEAEEAAKAAKGAAEQATAEKGKAEKGKAEKGKAAGSRRVAAAEGAPAGRP